MPDPKSFTPVVTNSLLISWDGKNPIIITLWDSNGAKHDVTPFFTGSAGDTQVVPTNVAVINSKIGLKKDGLSLTLDFIPLSRELTLGLSSSVVNQILQVVS